MTLPPEVEERSDLAKPDPATDLSIYINGPAELLVRTCVEQLRSVPEWAALFGITEDDPEGYLDSYQRMDYPIRALPALRVYNSNYDKEFESWFIEGDLVMDLIWPATLRREDQQQLQDTVSAALLQQFRRKPFFNAVSEKVPGLNQLGRSFRVDKSKGFEWQDEIVPLTQIRVNFKIDLRQWDLYLEANDRTLEDPFEYTLKNLEQIVTTVQGLRDDNKTIEVDDVKSDQSVK